MHLLPCRECSGRGDSDKNSSRNATGQPNLRLHHLISTSCHTLNQYDRVTSQRTIHRHGTQMFESPEIGAVPVLQFTKEYFRKKVIMDKNTFDGNSESSSESFSLYHRAGRNLFTSNRSLSLSELSGRAGRDRVGEAPRLFSYYTMPYASIPTGPATGNMPGWFVLECARQVLTLVLGYSREINSWLLISKKRQ